MARTTQRKLAVATTQDCTWVIGNMGAHSGDYASVGLPISDGVKYAVDQANAAGDVPCTLEIQSEDSQGSPDQAPAARAEALSRTKSSWLCRSVLLGRDARLG